MGLPKWRVGKKSLNKEQSLADGWRAGGGRFNRILAGRGGTVFKLLPPLSPPSSPCQNTHIPSHCDFIPIKRYGGFLGKAGAG